MIVGIRLPGHNGGLAHRSEDDLIVARIHSQSQALAGFSTDEADRKLFAEGRRSSLQGRSRHAEETIRGEGLIVEESLLRRKGQADDPVEQLESLSVNLAIKSIDQRECLLHVNACREESTTL